MAETTAEPATTMPQEGHTAFFYGTLMAPAVLHRVCNGTNTSTKTNTSTRKFKTRPALLPHHQRHRVRYADYPAITPRHGSSVRGTLVSGLTDADIWRLDIFEGSEYRREVVEVTLLDHQNPDQETQPSGGDDEAPAAATVLAETYLWKAPIAQLEKREWDFAEFQREKMKLWVGAEGQGEYAEVDEAVAAAESHDGTGGRGTNGHITQALDEEHRKDEIMRNAV